MIAEVREQFAGGEAELLPLSGDLALGRKAALLQVCRQFVSADDKRGHCLLLPVCLCARQERQTSRKDEEQGAENDPAGRHGLEADRHLDHGCRSSLLFRAGVAPLLDLVAQSNLCLLAEVVSHGHTRLNRLFA